MLYERGYSRDTVRGLYQFIDWVLDLPEDLEELYCEEIAKEEEVKVMPHITSMERIGMKKGLQQGLQQGMLENTREILLETLEDRFGKVPVGLTEKVQSISDRKFLRDIHRKLIRGEGLEAFEEELKEGLDHHFSH